MITFIILMKCIPDDIGKRYFYFRDYVCTLLIYR